eukprot:282720-Prorocentrum_minimum.AAC.1
MLSPDAGVLLRECVEARGDRLDVEDDLATWAYRSLSAFWRQRLLLVLATGLAGCALARPNNAIGAW